jgi:hypothetical protein
MITNYAKYLPYDLQFTDGTSIYTMHACNAKGYITLTDGKSKTYLISPAQIGTEYRAILKPLYLLYGNQTELNRYLTETTVPAGKTNPAYSYALRITWLHQHHYDTDDLLTTGIAGPYTILHTLQHTPPPPDHTTQQQLSL